MKEKIIIFGGTTEGRQEAEKALQSGHETIVCVTSDYAAKLLPAGAAVHVGAMDEEEMLRFFLSEKPSRIVDATHPFAEKARENIRSAAERAGLPLSRIERPADDTDFGDVVLYADSAEEAAEIMRGTEGNILLTTGSHSLLSYTRVLPLDRLFVRVLPLPKVLIECEGLGIMPGHLLAMQGPFPEAFNGALLDFWRIRVMCTKASGDVGGLRDKVIPALKRGITVVVIRRPGERDHA